MYKLGKNTKKNLLTITNKELILLVSQAIKLTNQDFCIIGNGGMRTAEEQNELFKKGVTKCDGYKIKSYHQSGNAVDLVPWIDGKPTWDAEATKEIVRVMKLLASENGVTLTCGADWANFYDPYHFEIRG